MNSRIRNLAFLAAIFCLVTNSNGQASADLLARVDHLVYATPDVKNGVEKLHELLGVTASPGGQHLGAGTCNWLLSLGPSTYLEIIGPDLEQPKPDFPRIFGIDELKAPKLVAWAANGKELEKIVTDAEQHRIMLGKVLAGGRKRPDGTVLSWHYTHPGKVVADRIVPFFIDWGQSQHPSSSATKGASLVDLRAEHPEAARVQKMLSDLGLNLSVQQGPEPALIATIDCPKGRVELR
ncbi:MAG: hypothetical protein QOI04_703 [Verrucomicrobiota bacterium]|jgi:hypothetical protein